MIGNHMNFIEAMNCLTSGSKVTRYPWKETVYFLKVGDEVKSFQPVVGPYLFDQDIMISDGWIISGEEGEHKFSNTIPYLQKGCAIKRNDWNKLNVSLDRETKTLLITSIEISPYIPTFESFCAIDWIEL